MRPYIFLLFVIIPTIGFAQTFEEVLEKIAQNNTQLKAADQLRQLEIGEAKTGRYLDDPAIEGSYLFGSPGSTGNQIELLVSQSFKYPGYYSALRKAAGRQVELAEVEFILAKKEIEIHAAQILTELIYQDQKVKMLESWTGEADTLAAAWQKIFDKGEATILELQKARKVKAEMTFELLNARARKSMLQLQLEQLNGGQPIELKNISFAAIPSPTSDSLMTFFDMNPYNEHWLALEQMQQEKIRVAKLNKLPEMEAGYRYESILDQSLQGPYIGLSIPLWEKKNTVQLEQARLEYIRLENQFKRERIEGQIRQSLAQLKFMEEQVSLLNGFFDETNNVQMLKRALELGQITIIEYYNEASQYYDLQATYLETLYQLKNEQVKWWVLLK